MPYINRIVTYALCVLVRQVRGKTYSYLTRITAMSHTEPLLEFVQDLKMEFTYLSSLLILTLAFHSCDAQKK